LNTLSEIGIFGLLSFIALIVLVLQIIKHDENKLITQKHIAAFALLEMFIHGLVDVPYFKNDLSVITWILFAIICVNNYERK
jgi:O-antigen ligase